MLVRLPASLYYLMYMTPSRESQVLVMLGSLVVTSLELQFPFGLASYFSIQFCYIFFPALKDSKVEISVKDGSPWSLSAVNKH